jgi:phosphoglycerate dehydrogenase-like enzyme
MRVALPNHMRELLQPRVPEGIDVSWYGDLEEALRAAATADVLWISFPSFTSREQIEKALGQGRQLDWLTTPGAGVDSFPLDAIHRRRLTLTNGSGLHATPIAEYVVMALLAAAKGFPELVRAQDRSEWLSRPPGLGELEGSRALVVGMGQIGRAIADRLRALNVEVTGVRRSGAEGSLRPDEWRAHLPNFDWVVLATPLTTGTSHLVGSSELGAMKKTAWLANIARGGLIDPDALVEALRDGSIGGAYLDATDPEPLPADSPLWKLPNVIISPHSSWASERLDQRAADLFLDNLERYRSGRPLRNVVDLEAGY